MASKLLSLNEVMDGLDGSDFEDDSDDDFDGYLDMDEEQRNEGESDEQRNEGEREEQGDEEESEERIVPEVQDVVGANIEIAADGSLGPRDGSDTPLVPEYTLQPGCSTSVDGESPLDFFSLLFTDEMLEHIVAQTNLNAQQFIDSHELAPHSRVRRWSKAVHDVNELRRFLAIIIVMGLVRYPQIEHHWATQWPYSNTHFSSVCENTLHGS